jgi:NAD(P)-dependent dehydrogenase (short-subunit alcohol dehydrogenase family)
MSISFDGRVAIVTGAGRGIGRDYALALASRGAKVVVNDNGPGEKPGSSRAQDVVAEIAAAGGEAVASSHDITSVTGGQAITDLAIDRFGTVDILINNAGILRRAMFEDLDLESVRATINVHLIAAFNVTQPAWKVMKAKGYGRVVMTSSAASFGMEGNSSYVAAKAGLLGLVPALALEGEPHGIKVNAVLPFAVSLMQSENPALAIPARDAAANVGYQRDLSHRSPASAVAAATLYLASEDCAISGEAISALSGRYARTFRVINEGWLRDTVEGVGPEHIRDHLAEIIAANGVREMRSMTDEFRDVRDRVFHLEGKPI